MTWPIKPEDDLDTTEDEFDRMMAEAEPVELVEPPMPAPNRYFITVTVGHGDAAVKRGGVPITSATAVNHEALRETERGGGQAT